MVYVLAALNIADLLANGAKTADELAPLAGVLLSTERFFLVVASLSAGKALLCTAFQSRTECLHMLGARPCTRNYITQRQAWRLGTPSGGSCGWQRRRACWLRKQTGRASPVSATTRCRRRCAPRTQPLSGDEQPCFGISMLLHVISDLVLQVQAAVPRESSQCLSVSAACSHRVPP